jgi:hypothetical protein
VDAAVRAGDTVWVETRDGQRHKGRVSSVTATRLALQIDRRDTEFPATDIRSITRKDRDGIGDGAGRGALYGLLAGTALGVIAVLSDCDNDGAGSVCSPGGVAVLGGLFGSFGAGVGAGLGLVVDALRTSPREVWRAPGISPTVPGVPSVGRRAMGVRLVVRW